MVLRVGGDHGKGPSTVDILQRPEMGAGVVTDVPYTGTQGTGWVARDAPPTVGWPPSGAFSRRSGQAPYLPPEEGRKGVGGGLKKLATGQEDLCPELGKHTPHTRADCGRGEGGGPAECVH